MQNFYLVPRIQGLIPTPLIYGPHIGYLAGKHPDETAYLMDTARGPIELDWSNDGPASTVAVGATV